MLLPPIAHWKTTERILLPTFKFISSPDQKMKAKASLVKATDIKLIERLSGWYLEEWGIPKETTTSRLCNFPNEVLLAQLVLKEGNRIVATGGLYHFTGLSIVFPEYKALSPWISQLHTDKPYRRKGYGNLLLQSLEEYAASIGITHVFIFTSTAERWYKRNGYKQIERVKYRGANTVVMEKFLMA